MSAQLEDGYTRIANELMDEISTLYLHGNEWKIVHFIMRKTWGWHKKEDRISLTQLQIGTNLPRPTVNKVIKKLVAQRLLVACRLPSGNSYQIQKDYSLWTSSVHTTGSVQATTLVASTLPFASSVHATHKRNYTKETIQKIERPKISELNDTHFEPIAQKYNVPISFVRSKYDDMVNWHESSGKQKKDWIATLRGFVKEDAVKVRKDHNARSKIEFINT
jgi:phage replication O-like protein O